MVFCKHVINNPLLVFLTEIDRLEMNFLLVDLERVQQRMDELEKVIIERCQNNDDTKLLRSILRFRRTGRNFAEKLSKS